MRKSLFHFSFRPISGRMVPKYPQQMRTYLIVNEGQELEGDFYPVKRKRTRGRADEKGNQDGFFFGVILPIIANDIWFTKNLNDAYYFTLDACSYKLEANPKGGAPFKRLVHVSDRDRDSMALWIAEVQMWAMQEHEVYLPDPDPTKSKRRI